MIKLFSLKQRGFDFNQIAIAYINLKKADLFIPIDELEAHTTAGGNVINVASALVFAQTSNVDLSVDLAKAIDLSGRDVIESIKETLNPKVIETNTISGVSRDGIEVKAKLRITLKPILTKVVGGTGTDSLMSKITENVSLTLSNFKDHKEALQNPDLISKSIQIKNLEKDSSFKILSIEVCDLSLGKNVWAQLKMDQIEIDKRLAQARAEEEQARAVLEAEQMKVRAEQMKVEKAKAEAEVPKALVKAFEDGKMSVLDYYKMQNIIADTNMRKSWTSK